MLEWIGATDAVLIIGLKLGSDENLYSLLSVYSYSLFIDILRQLYRKNSIVLLHKYCNNEKRIEYRRNRSEESTNKMKFSEIHGLNVQLNESKQKAVRNNSFYDGIVFSDDPIRINSFVPIKVCSPANQWLGSLFLGVTSRNPKFFIDNSLPKHIIGLCNEEDFWIKSIPSRWTDSNIIIHLTYDGLMEITSNQEPNLTVTFLSELPISGPLWLIIDLYGSSNSVQLATYNSPMSSEMLLLGPDMSTAFKCGAEGVVPYKRTRVMLIGPKNSGKSSLKKVIINNRWVIVGQFGDFFVQIECQ